jgi:hypothetical protein
VSAQVDSSAGLVLARQWYRDTVAPVLAGVPHAAALLGDGSEVLGFDDEISTDHDFGARVQIFCAADDLERTRALTGHVEVPGRAWVELASSGEFFRARLGFDPADGVSPAQWLATPTQRLGSLTAGAVFHDPDGELERRRAVLAWYPDDVWRYTLAAGWLRIDQHGPFLARTATRGDDLGSRLVAARMVRDLMRLAFLVERRWAPYDKWVGTAFGGLGLAAELGPSLDAALAADDWRSRERAVLNAGTTLLAATNALAVAPNVDPQPRQFWDRDIRVVPAMEAVRALLGAVEDSSVRRLADERTRTDHLGQTHPAVAGSVDQVTDSVEILSDPRRCAALFDRVPPA